jgi:Kdo2-lipid IVA lauroyltransferase/acyltransferase
MQALLFYLAYPFIYVLASLPFPVLYKVSDLCFHILNLTGYRKEVVLKNLRKSFPEKTEQQIRDIANQYYRYLCDLILETLKTLRMTQVESKEHCKFFSKPWLEQYYKEGRSIIIVMGHYGNWEWAGPAFTLNRLHQLVVIYRPLSNTYFERMMVGMRTKFGTKITPVQNTLRDMVSNRSAVTATAFIADQSAPKRDGHWMTFLNQDTSVFTGPEKLARKFNYPVVFMNVIRPKRGYYQVHPELLFDQPKNTSETEISEVFTKRLEEEIQKDPTIWLWSHKRWKYKRPVEVSVGTK